MKILFDQGTPVPLRDKLTGHSIRIAHEMGWSQLDNGDLLQAAESEFDVFITTDKNLPHQQNLSNRRLAILILPTTSWPAIQRNVDHVITAINSAKPGVCRAIAFP